ncbi:hypothetical protein [Nocardioides dongkuii]|uniref:hypothetical protein n=1 Tax=Nocardioides dongkuii TaxID=2760089 RepID=UPI0015FE1545|nr:hypothetical protein [Nocardioides dongkuii]
MKRSKKITIIASFVVLLVAGAAIAAWQITGTGSGSARAGTAGDLTVAPGSATGDLYPGSTDGDVFIKVTNPNSYPVKLTTATIAGPITPAECLVTASSDPVDLSAVPVIASGATVDVTLSDVLSMGDAPDSCQGVDLVVEEITVQANTAS